MLKAVKTCRNSWPSHDFAIFSICFHILHPFGTPCDSLAGLEAAMTMVWLLAWAWTPSWSKAAWGIEGLKYSGVIRIVSNSCNQLYDIINNMYRWKSEEWWRVSGLCNTRSRLLTFLFELREAIRTLRAKCVWVTLEPQACQAPLREILVIRKSSLRFRSPGYEMWKDIQVKKYKSLSRWYEYYQEHYMILHLYNLYLL